MEDELIRMRAAICQFEQEKVERHEKWAELGGTDDRKWTKCGRKGSSSLHQGDRQG